MDIIASASAVVGLVFSFATAAKTCNAVRDRYKAAALTLDSIRQELETLQAALQQLANLMMHDASALTSQWDTDHSLSGTFARSMKGFERTIKGLQAELDKLKYENQVLGRLEKAKVVWNEDGMREHLSRLRSQAGALQLLLQVLQTGAVSEVKKHVRNLEAALVNAAVTSTSVNFDKSGDSIANLPIFLNDQEDLLDLEWSEKNSENGPSTQALQSAHLDLLREEFTVDVDDTLETESMSSNHSTGPEPKMGNPFQDPMTQPASPSPNKRGQVEYEVELESPRPTPILSNTSPAEAPSLIRAVIRGDLEVVIDLLDNGCDIETLEPQNKRTGLMLAALLDYPEILQLLLDRGADIAAVDRARRTALHLAASEGSYQCAKLLLSFGAPVDKYDKFNDVPLHLAARYGKTNIAKLLLPQYSDPLAFIDRQRENALHLAVRFAKVDMVELICNHIKIFKHSHNCYNFLREDKKDAKSAPSCPCPVVYPHLEDADRSGYTALHLGVMYHNPRAVSFLLRCSKSLAEMPMSNYVPLKHGGERIPWTRSLHYAVRNEKTTGDMFKTLINGGADVNSVDCHGKSPLTVAKQAGSSKAITFLESHGAVHLPPQRSTTGIRRMFAHGSK